MLIYTHSVPEILQRGDIFGAFRGRCLPQGRAPSSVKERNRKLGGGEEMRAVEKPLLLPTEMLSGAGGREALHQSLSVRRTETEGGAWIFSERGNGECLIDAVPSQRPTSHRSGRSVDIPALRSEMPAGITERRRLWRFP